MSQYAALQFSFQVTAPIFLIILTGLILKARGFITEEFAKYGSSLVFNVTLPALLFNKIVSADFSQPPLFLILYGAVILILVFLFLEIFIASQFTEEDRGVFVQGVIRSNLGIVGLAYCLAAFGDKVIPVISVYLACIIILVNILSIITLSRHSSNRQVTLSFISILKSTATNPLILSIAAALIVSNLNITIFPVITDTLDYLSNLTLPLALLCTGASIRWHEFKSSKTLYLTIVGKLILFPAVVTFGAIFIGFRDMELGILYLMMAAPTAAASYPMVRALGGNQHLAAAIIAATAFFSMVTTTIGLFLLRNYNLL